MSTIERKIVVFDLKRTPSARSLLRSIEKTGEIKILEETKSMMRVELYLRQNTARQTIATRRGTSGVELNRLSKNEDMLSYQNLSGIVFGT